MRLADFIEKNTEPIIAEWVTFAESSGPAGQAMDRTELRDHAVEMLAVIVKDLRTPQSATEQTEKGKITHTDVNLLNRHIAMSHSLLEDTLLFVALGVAAGWIIFPRLIMAFIVVWTYRLIFLRNKS